MILKPLQQTLLNRRRQIISAKKFNLMLELLNAPTIASLRDRCLGLLVTSEVKELVLIFWRGGLYNLPQYIF